MTTRLRVHFDGRVLVPEEPVDLPIGQSMEIRLGSGATSIAPGTPAAVLAAALAEPHVSSDDVDELERAIADAKLPPTGGIDLNGDGR